MYAAKHHRYDLLNLYDMQNDADSMTTLRIGQNSGLIQMTSDTFLNVLFNFCMWLYVHGRAHYSVCAHQRFIKWLCLMLWLWSVNECLLLMCKIISYCCHLLISLSLNRSAVLLPAYPCQHQFACTLTALQNIESCKNHKLKRHRYITACNPVVVFRPHYVVRRKYHDFSDKVEMEYRLF